MIKVVRKLVLPSLVVCVALMSGCEFNPDAVGGNPNPNYRDVFVGDFSFTWEYTVTEGDSSTTQVSTYDGKITMAAENMLDFEYRPGIYRRMIVSEAGVLTDPVSNGEGYISGGAFNGTDAVQIEIEMNQSASSSHSLINGARL